MRVLRGSPGRWDAGSPLALAVGVFDGVHTGHLEVLRLVHRAAESSDLTPGVLTFYPHPMALIAPDRAPKMLGTIDQRIDRLEAAGVDLVAVLAFDESVRSMSPEAFVEEILVDRLKVRFVVAGRDFRFGKNRGGDVDLLASMGPDHGFDTTVVELVGESAPVSSTRIRNALGAGDVAAAATLLGRSYELVGTVVPGSGRGTGFGVATANVDVDGALSIPRRGVYAVRAGASERVPGVANIGVRPTFGEEIEVVEVHLIDRYLDVVGETIHVEFVERLRDEDTFAGVSELAEQIRTDIATARDILG